jgi:hypothetical protein
MVEEDERVELSVLAMLEALQRLEDEPVVPPAKVDLWPRRNVRTNKEATKPETHSS